jgi:uncharacterized protein YwbE
LISGRTDDNQESIKKRFNVFMVKKEDQKKKKRIKGEEKELE